MLCRAINTLISTSRCFRYSGHWIYHNAKIKKYRRFSADGRYPLRKVTYIIIIIIPGNNLTRTRLAALQGPKYLPPYSFYPTLEIGAGEPLGRGLFGHCAESIAQCKQSAFADWIQAIPSVRKCPAYAACVVMFLHAKHALATRREGLIVNVICFAWGRESGVAKLLSCTSSVETSLTASGTGIGNLTPLSRSRTECSDGKSPPYPCWPLPYL